MPTLHLRAIMTALTISGITSAASALSLANFTPRIENLPQQCQGVYTTPIAGCEAGDFTDRSPGSTCSSACVSGLVAIMKAVESACATVDVPETSIIGVFLLGKGIPSLCPGIEVVTVSPSASVPARTTQAPAKSTSEAQATTTSSKDDDEAETTSTSADPTSTSSVAAIDTSVPTTFATSAPAPETASQTSSARATTTATQQKSNADSGGGSPFDVVATGGEVAVLPVKRWVLSAVVGVVAMMAGAV